MASLAESSVASIPIAKLAQLRDELLQDQASGDDAQRPQATDNTTSSNVVSDNDINNVDAVVPESANAHHASAPSPRPTPRLSNSRSAPPTEMEAMLQPSPSQEAFAAMTRASSFHGYPGGDTQPMESQVYRDFTASIVKPATTTPKKPIMNVQISPDGEATYTTVAQDDTLRTCVEGDTGYVDLGGYEPSSPTALSTSSHVDELLENAQTQHQAEDAFVKPAMPETPALAGNKRDSKGELVRSSSTTKKTPGFSQLFGAHEKGQILSATQLFNQTQAPSSPPLDGPRSDPIVTRPSPNVHHQVSVSSPTLLMSSPVATTSRPGTAGEPRANYTSMRESQERRAAKLRQELGLSKHFSDDVMEEEDDEQDTQTLRAAQKRRLKAVNDQAFNEWSKVRAPSRQISVSKSRHNASPYQSLTIDLITPAADKRKSVNEEHSDDDEFFDNGETTEGQADETDNSDDEWDELGQTVLRSQANNDDESDDAGQNDIDADEDMRMGDGEGELRDSPIQGSPNRTNADQSKRRKSPTGTQHTAIADSQPVQADSGGANVPKQSLVPSSITSFVPGSQYAAKASQDKPKSGTVAATSSSKPHSGYITQADDDDVPSSPPVQAPRLRQEVSNASAHQAISQVAIPESDLPDTMDVHGLSSGAPAEDSKQRESNTVLYSTARTHVSAAEASSNGLPHGASPLKVFESQQSKFSFSQSPRTAAGVRHFSAIAAGHSPPAGSGETDVDVDAIVGDIVTADDQEFMKVVSTPDPERRSKRRKVTHDYSKLAASRRSDAPAQERSSAIMAPEKEQILQAAEGVEGRYMASTALQDSPSKANEQPSTTSHNDKLDNSLPESVKKREQAGANAASQVLSTRKAKLSKAMKQYGKNNKRQSLARQRSPTSASSDEKTTQLPQKLRTQNLLGVAGNVTEQPAGLDEGATDDFVPNEPVNIIANVPSGPPLQGGHVSGTTPSAPNRVFALFKGQFNSFYPATYVGTSPDGLNYHVKFDDGSTTAIEPQHVRRLELLIGDIIKVDMKDMRKQMWRVEGFSTSAHQNDLNKIATDIHGHTNVKISVKSSRESDTNITRDLVDVPISTIYLTRTMWPHFTNREFNTGSTANGMSRVGTPSSTGQTPHMEAVNSRSGRLIIPTEKTAGTRASHLRDESASIPDSPAMHGVFSGMAFAISYGGNEGEKASITRLIRRHGGIILENGFDELFDLPNLEESMPRSPAKKSPRKEIQEQEEHAALQLKQEYKGLGFVALIADGHSRRAKYFQALALSLPTLSGRWITDSLDASKNAKFPTSNPAPLPWPKYLFPAGESAYLGGAIRSRTLAAYEATEARLSDIIASRDILLNSDGVLIVASKKGKTWERKKTYAFLTLALGAASVKRVFDLAEAKTFVSSEPEKWKWVYVDGSVAEASAVIFDSGNTGKKRKRGEDGFVKVDDKAMCATSGDVKVVNDEFVVQSLILGALVD